MKISIIGSAGRKDDRKLMAPELWSSMVDHAMITCSQLVPETESIDLKSGGAAFADHLAVALFLNGTAASLTLHFPAEFFNSAYTQTHDQWSPGNTSNHYHDNFRKACHVDGLRQIQRAIDAGAITTVSSGFKARNILVAKCDFLLAYTFGISSGLFHKGEPGWTDHHIAGLKTGGTAHTWDTSPAPRKLHTNLRDL